MENDVADDAKAVVVDRPTTKSEWTLIAALVVATLFSMLTIGVLAWWGHWTDHVEKERVGSLGLIGEMFAGGVLLVIVACASPYVGRVVAKAPGGAELQIDGTKR